MKKYLIILLFVVSCSSQNNLTESNLKCEKYSGGRFGFSGVNLEIFSDNSYQYSSFMHSGSLITDTGYLTFKKGKFYLNSKKTIRKFKGKTISKKKNFKMQEVFINADTIRLIPKKQSESEFYEHYYSLIKEKNESFDEKIIKLGGEFDFIKYQHRCAIYKFSKNGDKSEKWNTLNPNDIEKISKIVEPIKQTLENRIMEYSNSDFFNRLSFSSVDVNFKDSIANFENRNNIHRICNSKYYFYYYFKPVNKVKYCIGFAVNEKGEILSKFNFPSKSDYKNIDRTLDVNKVLKIARSYKNIKPIKEITFEYDKKQKRFYWLIKQKEKRIKANRYKYNVLKIDASDISKVEIKKEKYKSVCNAKFF